MIHLTGEMLDAAHQALAPGQATPPGLVRALHEVLTLIERDHLTSGPPDRRGPGVTDAMVQAAWRAMPSWMQEGSDPDEVRRILAAGLAESRAVDEVRIVAQHPDVEGDW